MQVLTPFLVVIALALAGCFILLLHIVVHEAGHAIAALFAGWKVDTIQIGHKPELFSFRLPWPVAGARVIWGRGMLTSGLVRAVRTGHRCFRIKQILYSAGGPIATLLLGILSVLLWLHLEAVCTFVGWQPSKPMLTLMGIYLKLSTINGLLALVYTLYPQKVTIDGELTDSDGLGIWKAWTFTRQQIIEEYHRDGVFASLRRTSDTRKNLRRAVLHLVRMHSMEYERFDRAVQRMIALHLYSFGRKERAIWLFRQLEFSSSTPEDMADNLDMWASAIVVDPHRTIAELENALDMILKAKQLPLDTRKLLHLAATEGSLYAELGRTADARECLERVLANLPKSESITSLALDFNRTLPACYLATVYAATSAPDEVERARSLMLEHAPALNALDACRPQDDPPDVRHLRRVCARARSLLSEMPAAALARTSVEVSGR